MKGLKFKISIIVLFFFLIVSCNQTEKCGTPDASIKIIEESAKDGKALFQSNCASCHHPIKKSTGPALKDILNFHSSDWIYKYVTNKSKRIEADCIEHKYSLDNIECVEFSYLKKEEVQAIFTFVSGCQIRSATY